MRSIGAWRWMYQPFCSRSGRTRRRRACRPGCARAGRGIAPHAGGRTACRSRCRGTSRVVAGRAWNARRPMCRCVSGPAVPIRKRDSKDALAPFRTTFFFDAYAERRPRFALTQLGRGRGLAGLSEARPDLLRRSGGAPRLLPRRVRRAPQVARRQELRRPGGAVPVLAGAGQQPGRHGARARARAGWPGALAAWLGFTLPSALALIAFAFGVTELGDLAQSGAVHGLKVVAVAVVAQAVWGMAQVPVSGPPAGRRRGRRGPARAGACRRRSGRSPPSSSAAAVGRCVLPPRAPAPRRSTATMALGTTAGHRRSGCCSPRCWSCCRCCGAVDRQSPALALFAGFYRAGALVFGGGHVVLPLLQAGVVPPRLGVQRRLPGRLRRGAGRAGAALHLRGLSRRGHAGRRRRLARRR